ncbi:MAG: sulfide-dependent adenosine diphosphate thiazole synthase [Archaeoglobaceae archaeon]|nr:sulfide-dependent adenosine diphosphate thiazole synthase [Archaeoglobaceae archaeon]MCX8151632.1 sulfide-dependent adenosine diphosphate thiazole synthase [Archaeoglobaceae archaeon]MDW8013090.1 sulfide-dependent adenosine diphosphate thiazole synthase [Archaeoglobaceae archaeon]
MEAKITKAIIDEALKDWIEFASCDVVIAGAGPAGLTAGKYLAEKGYKTLIFERRLSFGGGIGGGGMLFHKIALEKDVKDMLENFGIRTIEKGEILVCDTSEFMAKLASKCVDAGAKIVFGVTVDDVIFRKDPLRIVGVCIQWSSVEMSGLHVDPMFIESRAVIDATGHDAEVVAIASRKVPLGISILGERSAFAEEGERLVVEKTGKIVDGLYVAGMAVAAVYNLPRMGPIFGGMLKSGKRVAEIVSKDLR